MADKDAFDRATRIVAADDGTNYDNVAIALHWLTALLVVVQFGLAETWDWFSDDTSETMQRTHVSLGILLTAVVVARLIWRWLPGHQIASLESGWVRAASKGVHYLLYVLLVAQAALGWTIGWGGGHPIHFFGLGIPSRIGPFPRPVRHDVREIHSLVGWTIVIVAFAHALAALYHHYALHDRVLKRILPAGIR